MEMSDYQAKYFAYELARSYANDQVGKLAGLLFDAQVEPKPHQVDAVLFALGSHLTRGVILADEVGLGSALTAGDSAIATAGDPIAAVREALPAWVAVPYLIAAFGGLLLSNHVSVYSAGLTTITLGIRIPRVFAVIVDVVVTTSGALYFMLISDGFYGPFITFISLLAVPLTAWIGIFLGDMQSAADTPSVLHCAQLASHLAHTLGTVIVRAGEQGAWIAQRSIRGMENAMHIPTIPVHPVDTNGAGDCHTGTLAALLLEDMDLYEALHRANIAAALATEHKGPAICPAREEVEHY